MIFIRPIRYSSILICVSMFSIFGFSASASTENKAADKLSSDVGNSSHNPTMDSGAQILKMATSMEADARGLILHANKIRKQVNQLRVKQRKLKDAESKKLLTEAISTLAEEIVLWQEQGATFREKSYQLKHSAMSVLSDGFQTQWSSWVTNTSPLVMDAAVGEVLAHNAQIRSVQPNMPVVRPASMDTPMDESMTLKVPSMTGQQVPGDLDVSPFQVSRDQYFFAHIEVKPDEKGKAAKVPVNEIHKWHLMVSDLSGAPVSGAVIEYEGHMPGHVHGLPTQPRITQEIAPGVYLIEGVKFQMSGWWVIQLHVDDKKQKDTLTFNLVL